MIDSLTLFVATCIFIVGCSSSHSCDQETGSPVELNAANIDTAIGQRVVVKGIASSNQKDGAVLETSFGRFILPSTLHWPDDAEDKKLYVEGLLETLSLPDVADGGLPVAAPHGAYILRNSKWRIDD